MYSTTSKPQEGSTCKDSLPKCFMTTNSTAKLSRGAVNRGGILRTCFHLNFYTSIKQYTVEPLLSGPPLSGHTLLNGQMSKSQEYLLYIIKDTTSIKRPPLLSQFFQTQFSPQLNG